MKDIQLDDVFIYLLERTERQTKRYANAALKNAGVDLTPEQWAILKRISEREALNQREIAELTFKDPASVTRALDVLEKRGLVQRVDAAGDRRAYNLRLTTEGLTMVELVTPIARAVRAQGLTGVSPEELVQFKAVLNKIYQNFS
jgi:DNA-binding MarR family transcriptional regulator